MDPQPDIGGRRHLQEVGEYVDRCLLEIGDLGQVDPEFGWWIHQCIREKGPKSGLRERVDIAGDYEGADLVSVDSYELCTRH